MDGRSSPPHLLSLADYLDSIEHSREAIAKLGGALPILRAVDATCRRSRARSPT